MRSTTRQFLIISTAGLLAIPGAYFIMINILKHQFGMDALYNSSIGVFERLGVQHGLGWNINLLIVMGPIAGMILAISQVVKLSCHFNSGQILLRLVIQKRKFPLLVAGFSGGLTTFFLIYLLRENCL